MVWSILQAAECCCWLFSSSDCHRIVFTRTVVCSRCIKARPTNYCYHGYWSKRTVGIASFVHAKRHFFWQCHGFFVFRLDTWKPLRLWQKFHYGLEHIFYIIISLWAGFAMWYVLYPLWNSLSCWFRNCNAMRCFILYLYCVKWCITLRICNF